ncbi:fimbrial assembly protein [Sporosarcina sp. ACRSM]|uniref:PilN domain-containing protein n=1 Tax=Sporosarcina sp. ACRSM TaxID=2918216 RepID=UPI001EF5EF0A|nr:fimbrial assembly protein [Sporosarcina sp. ACRSM]MCG7336984.1 fimbrial assembly protein [Sporosarcina sp. ACRSM]
MLVDINLLPEKERERSSLLVAALAIIGAAVLFWVVFFMITNNLTKETVTLEQQLESVQASQEAIRSDIRRSESEDSKKQLALTVEWAEAYQYDTVPLLHDLIQLLPKRGFFQSFDFTSPHLASVVVQFDTKPDAAYYFARLEASSSISNVTLESVTVADDSEGGNATDLLPRYIATYSLEFVDDRSITEEDVSEETEEGGMLDD